MFLFTLSICLVLETFLCLFLSLPFVAALFFKPTLPQSKTKLNRTKKMLQLGAGLYIITLLLLGTTGHVEFAIVEEIFSIGVALNACGSGATKVSLIRKFRPKRQKRYNIKYVYVLMYHLVF